MDLPVPQEALVLEDFAAIVAGVKAGKGSLDARCATCPLLMKCADFVSTSEFSVRVLQALRSTACQWQRTSLPQRYYSEVLDPADDFVVSLLLPLFLFRFLVIFAVLVRFWKPVPSPLGPTFGVPSLTTHHSPNFLVAACRFGLFSFLPHKICNLSFLWGHLSRLSPWSPASLRPSHSWKSGLSWPLYVSDFRFSARAYDLVPCSVLVSSLKGILSSKRIMS